LDNQTKIIGIWDDHDYGVSDGDSSNPHKEWFREKFLDFIDEPDASLRRTRQGIFESYYLDLEGRIKIVMLDLHFARVNNDDLGPQQWAWLEDQLQDERPEIILLVSGSPVIAHDRIIGDKLDNTSRNRLFKLINKLESHGIRI
jgi:alkaline phosphatase D